jgi:hypothetical protein
MSRLQKIFSDALNSFFVLDQKAFIQLKTCYATNLHELARERFELWGLLLEINSGTKCHQYHTPPWLDQKSLFQTFLKLIAILHCNLNIVEKMKKTSKLFLVWTKTWTAVLWDWKQAGYKLSHANSIMSLGFFFRANWFRWYNTVPIRSFGIWHTGDTNARHF